MPTMTEEVFLRAVMKSFQDGRAAERDCTVKMLRRKTHILKEAIAQSHLTDAERELEEAVIAQMRSITASVERGEQMGFCDQPESNPRRAAPRKKTR